MSEKKESMPILAQWLEPECTIDDERSAGVTVARKVRLNRVDYEGAVTVEVFGDLGRHSNDALDGDWPETWSGDESLTLTAKGARRLAHILTVAAMTSDSHRKALGLWVADASKERDAVAEAVAAERAAIRAEIERRITDAEWSVDDVSTFGLVSRFEARAFAVLRDWLDARSKGEVSR
jgi:hypothetical protein